MRGRARQLPRPPGVGQSIRLGAQGRVGSQAGRTSPAADARRTGDDRGVLRRHQDRRRSRPAEHALDRVRLRLRPRRRPPARARRQRATPASSPRVASRRLSLVATHHRRRRRSRRGHRARAFARARFAGSRGGADEPRRGGVLAVLVGQHRPPQGVRPPAARHARLRRNLRAGHPADGTSGSVLQRRQALLRLRPRERHVLPVLRRRHGNSLARHGHARRRLRPRRALPADVVLLGADALRDAAGASRGRARARSLQYPVRRLGRRVAAAGDLRTVSLALRDRDPGRHRIDGSAPHLHLESPRPGHGGIERRHVPGYEARLVDEAGYRSPRARPARC